MDKENFDNWNNLKQQIQQKPLIQYKQGEIYFMSVGQNIGYEVFGKKELFLRPVLVYKKLSKQTFIGIPLSSKEKQGSYFFNFQYTEKTTSTALLNQIRVFDIRRAKYFDGNINFSDFGKLKSKILSLLDITPNPKGKGSGHSSKKLPKCKESISQNILTCQENLKTLCIIPARGGSKGVPKKNIKLLNNIPLIGYSIQSAKQSQYIDKIIVSTDCQEIKNVAEQFDIKVPFLRPKELATDTSLDIDFIRHTLQWLQKNENYTPNLVVLLRPTTPLRDATVIDDAIKKMIEYKNNSSLRSAHEVSESPFKWFKEKDGIYQPICDNYTLEDTNKPRQSFEKVYIPNGYVDIINPNTITKENDLYGSKICKFITTFSYEIDTIEDFEFIEYKISKDKKYENTL